MGDADTPMCAFKCGEEATTTVRVVFVAGIVVSYDYCRSDAERVIATPRPRTIARLEYPVPREVPRG